MRMNARSSSSDVTFIHATECSVNTVVFLPFTFSFKALKLCLWIQNYLFAPLSMFAFVFLSISNTYKNIRLNQTNKHYLLWACDVKKTFMFWNACILHYTHSAHRQFYNDMKSNISSWYIIVLSNWSCTYVTFSNLVKHQFYNMIS